MLMPYVSKDKKEKHIKYIKRRFDLNGNEILRETFSEFKEELNKEKELVETWKYAEDNAGYARYVNAYDSLGNKTLEEFYGIEKDTGGKATGKLILKENRFGIARYIRLYDAKGILLLEEFCGADAKLKGNEEGIARKAYKYDADNHLISLENYNTKNELTRDKFGIGRYELKYDDKGRLTTRAFYNEAGNLFAPQFEVLRTDYSYDKYYPTYQRQPSS